MLALAVGAWYLYGAMFPREDLKNRYKTQAVDQVTFAKSSRPMAR